MCQDLKIPLLGKVPLDPRIAKSCDKGQSFWSKLRIHQPPWPIEV